MTTCFFYVQNDMSKDSTTQVITTKHFAKRSAGNRQFHVTFYIRFVSAAKDLSSLRLWHTTHDKYDITLNVGIFTCTYDLLQCQVTTITSSTTFYGIGHKVNASLNDTLLITTTISLMDIACSQRGTRNTRTVSHQGSVVVILSNIGTRIGRSVAQIVLTVATAIDIANLVGT